MGFRSQKVEYDDFQFFDARHLIHAIKKTTNFNDFALKLKKKWPWGKL